MTELRRIDQKYWISTEGDIYNSSGEIIPRDEPLILFRGRDKCLPAMLARYYNRCAKLVCPARHLNVIRRTIDAVRNFHTQHSDLVVVPGSTPPPPDPAQQGDAP